MQSERKWWGHHKQALTLDCFFLRKDNANHEVVKSVGECDREHIEIIEHKFF
jgi:hypothetical protein